MKEYAPESFITTYDGNQLIALGIRESLSLWMSVYFEEMKLRYANIKFHLVCFQMRRGEKKSYLESSPYTPSWIWAYDRVVT